MSVDSSSRIRLVTIGGGTGSSILLRGLKRYADRVDITAIVTTFDDGGSSGRLSEEFGVPALGDLRRCIAALLPSDADESAVGKMLEHRFASGGSLDDHSLGNLMLLGMWQRYENLSSAIDALSASLGILGRVIPVSDQPTTLCGELDDGSIVRGESVIGTRNEALSALSQVYLAPPVAANSAVLEALLTADVTILGPGDLFTSVIPNLLPGGVIGAIQRSSSRILQICNIASKAGETGGYAASDFVVTVNRYLKSDDADAVTEKRVDAILVNEFGMSATPLEGRVEIDDKVREMVEIVVVRQVSDAAAPRRHDSDKLAAAVMEYVDAAIGCR